MMLKNKRKFQSKLPPKNWISQWETKRLLSQNAEILKVSDSIINKSVIDYSKDNNHITWTTGLNVLENPKEAKRLLPKGIFIGRKYMFLVKVVLLNFDLEKSGGRTGHTYLMCGTQSIFNYDKDDSLKDLLLEIEAKVRITLEDYKMEDVELQCVQVLFWNIGLSIKKENTYIKDNRAFALNKIHKNDFTLPIYTDSSILGKPLNVEYDSKGYVTKIETGLNNPESSFIDLVTNKIKLTNKVKTSRWDKFDSTWKFYDVIFNSRNYILGVHTYDTSTVEKVLFTNTGSILYSVTDYYDKNGEFMTRISGNKTIQGDKYHIYDVSRQLKLTAIPNLRNKFNVHQFIPNTNIGCLDCETFIDTDNVNKIYAIGFKDNINKNSHLYHINDYKGNSNKMVVQFIDDIMAPKYNNISFYCHNWGGFDAIFIIKVLNNFNQSEYNKYKMTYHFRDNRIYKLVIQNISDKNRRVTICDSWTILNSSLDDLCKSFDIEGKKSYFPYKFVSRETLTYTGVTPSRDYYNDIPIEEYDNMLSKKWNLYQESLNYLDNDIDILIKILNKANNQLFNDYNVNISDKSTIAGLATKIFMKDHYKGNIPFINKSTIYNDIKKGYYGGITEVYKPYGENLYYYDVNSLYPSVALNAMPGVDNAKKVEYIDKQPDIKDLFGFYYCDIETPKNLYFGVLPVRNENGLIFPLGSFSGWYFSEELKYAVSLGYKIKIYKGYHFEKQFDTFKSYVDKIYSIKSNASNETQKSIAKGLLNNLLGRFGISLYKPITKIVDTNTYYSIMSKFRVVDHKYLNDNNILVTYYDILDPILIEQSELEIEELFNGQTSESSQHASTSIVISAAVTAYARVAISKIKLDILNFNGNIYYSDTDSIVTDIELPSNMVSPTELGKLKLEHTIKKGIFISGKTYCFINDKDKFINKAKGLSNLSLKWDDYKQMLENLLVIGKKKISNINWEVGEVSISTKEVELKPDVYKKRDKLYTNDIWSDTKPITLDTPNNDNVNDRNITSTGVNNIKNILTKTPLVTKRFYSNQKMFDVNQIKDANLLIKSKTAKFYSNIISLYKDIKDFMFDIAMVCLVLILYIVYWAFKLDDDILYDSNHEHLEIDSYESTDIDVNNIKLLDEKKASTVKGHHLLDDSLYDSKDYTTPSTIAHDKIYTETQSVENNVESNSNENISINNHLYDYHINDIRKLEISSSMKSIIIDPYNSEEFDPNKTYINYVLSENNYVPNEMLIELGNNGSAYPIEGLFKLTYEPRSIVRDSYHEQDINLFDEENSCYGTPKSSVTSGSEYFSVLEEKTEANMPSDDDTVVSIINCYYEKKNQT